MTQIHVDLESIILLMTVCRCVCDHECVCECTTLRALSVVVCECVCVVGAQWIHQTVLTTTAGTR